MFVSAPVKLCEGLPGQHKRDLPVAFGEFALVVPGLLGDHCRNVTRAAKGVKRESLRSRYYLDMTVVEVFDVALAVTGSLGGGGAIVFGLSGYLGRVWADRALEKQKLESATVIAELNQKLSVITEQAKGTLQLLALEHQIRFSSLHAKRANVIEKTYKFLVKARKNCVDYVFSGAHDPGPESQESWKRIWSEMKLVADYIDVNRIYFPENISSKVTLLAEGLTRLVFEARTYAKLGVGSDEKAQKERKKMDEIVNSFLQQGEGGIPAAMADLETEFRKLLDGGVVIKRAAGDILNGIYRNPE